MRKRSVRDIVLTTDGFLGGKSHIKKPRNVVVVYQRGDKCLLVSKIIGAEHHEKDKAGTRIRPSRKNGLEKPSDVEYKLMGGQKMADGSYRPFRMSDFQNTGFRISFLDLFRIRFAILKNPKKRAFLRKWKRRFK